MLTVNLWTILMTAGSCWAELWEKDMTEEIYIEASTEGFELVRTLKKTFDVNLEQNTSKIFFKIKS
jgi:hypothetical protein